MGLVSLWLLQHHRKAEAAFAELLGDLEVTGGRSPERWVEVEVEEAYIHCSKHIPLLKKLDKEVDWGTDDEVKKGGDFFEAKKTPSPWKGAATSDEAEGQA